MIYSFLINILYFKVIKDVLFMLIFMLAHVHVCVCLIYRMNINQLINWLSSRCLGSSNYQSIIITTQSKHVTGGFTMFLAFSQGNYATYGDVIHCCQPYRWISYLSRTTTKRPLSIQMIRKHAKCFTIAKKLSANPPERSVGWARCWPKFGVRWTAVRREDFLLMLPMWSVEKSRRLTIVHRSR